MNMLLDCWKHFNKDEMKNKFHHWATCKSCDFKCAGTKDAMVTHFRKCSESPEDLQDRYYGSSSSSSSSTNMKKRKKSQYQTESKIVNSHSTPVTKK